MKLNIGSRVRAEGWKTFDIQEGPEVDYVGSCQDLSRFSDASVETIYASHVLEHLSFIKERQAALADWFRVLTPGGTLMVSVPDFETLCRLFLLPNIDLNTRFGVMRMAFGGHLDPHDVHHTGFNFDLLAYFLTQAGFRNIRRVDQFGLFQDTSGQKFDDIYISLNVIAGKPA